LRLAIFIGINFLQTHFDQVPALFEIKFVNYGPVKHFLTLGIEPETEGFLNRGRFLQIVTVKVVYPLSAFFCPYEQAASEKDL
jgi:hypothetical protein